MGLGDRLLNRIVREVVSQGTHLASQAMSEGFDAYKDYNKTQRVLANERENNKIIYARNLLLARLAVAYYIAQANGEMAAEEKEEIKKLTSQIYSSGNITGQMNEAIKLMASMSTQGFVFLQKYLQPINNADLIDILSIADEVANADGQTSESERAALDKLRDYVSDKTGRDFTEVEITDEDMNCQNCGGHMEISDGGGKLVCQFCGTTRVISERKLYSELKEYNFAGVSVNDDFFDVLEARLSRGQKIDAIKFAMDKLKISISDAKAYVETYETEMDRNKYSATLRGKGRVVN